MASDPSPRQIAAPAPVEFNIARTVPGRLFILAAGVLLVLWGVRQFVELPAPIELFRQVASFALRFSALWLVALLIVRYRRGFLWRVRRKLILSYMFLGFVPVALGGLFALTAGFMLHANISGYLFRQGLDDIVVDVHQIAAGAASEIGETLVTSDVVLTRTHLAILPRYRNLSLAVVPVAEAGGAGPVAKAGDWKHMPIPPDVPEWVSRKDFQGLLTMLPEGQEAADGDEERLLIRASVPLRDGRHVVLADLPVDTDISSRLDEQTGIRMTEVAVRSQDEGAAPVVGRPLPSDVDDEAAAPAGVFEGLFRRTVLSNDFVDWRDGRTGLVYIGLDAPLVKIYQRVVSNEASQVFNRVFPVLAGLLLIVQVVALFFGVGLGRQITSAVHELFEGTERVQQGDFTYRVKVDSNDQLGALGDSFNRMSASIEHLLHVQREKQRLDDELRIAHEIQTSLLPERPPAFDGLSIADLCVPAREVGGDYYDFFQLGPRQLGVLVADVSGKGTSAALYMAELKGLMLALSHQERSPKQLLTRVNHLLADHLDNRSFITMTYGVIDLDAGTLTHARGGHTPLIVASRGQAEVIVPNGMVLGLRLPGAADRFEALLEEHTLRLSRGDVIVFYTDGVTEAMNRDGDLFGDAALGRVVSSHGHLDAAGIRERVLRDVRAFVGDAEPHDDMTMVIVKVV